MKINIKLDTRSVKMAIRNIKRYQQQLDEKCALFVQRLADEGITVAKLNAGEYGHYITFSKEVTNSNHKAIGRLIAVGTSIERIRKGQVILADPLLLAEFGSGWEARVLDKVGEVGQGTFPGQTHAFDPQGWWYVDAETGESVHSFGEEPTFPMHNAALAMILAVNRVAREVFGNGR